MKKSLLVATLASAVLAPPVPVFPWSSAWTESVSAPVNAPPAV